MPRKHRSNNAARLKQSGNAFHALGDLPLDETNPTLDGSNNGDDDDELSLLQVLRATNATLAKTAFLWGDTTKEMVNYIHRTSETTKEIRDTIVRMDECTNAHLEHFNNMLEGTLKQMEAVLSENTILRQANEASRAETAALKVAVDALTQKFDEHTAKSAPPSPEIMAPSASMEEMTTQLSIVHNDIQDVLDAVLNPNTKRKRRSGHQDIEPTSDTTQRLMTHKQRRNASPEHSLMHSIHATTTAQDKLDALKIKYPPCSPAITPTETLPNSLPQVSPQVTPLPDVPSTAPAEGEGWKIVEGKTMRRKKRSEQTSNQKAAPNNDNTPTTKTGRRGKSTYQPKPTTTPTKKTWAEVVKSGGINVQIVLGNDHLQLITPTTRARRERQGGAARRLKKKARAGGGTEEERRGRSSPAVV